MISVYLTTMLNKVSGVSLVTSDGCRKKAVDYLQKKSTWMMLLPFEQYPSMSGSFKPVRKEKEQCLQDLTAVSYSNDRPAIYAIVDGCS